MAPCTSAWTVTGALMKLENEIQKVIPSRSGAIAVGNM